MAHMAGTVVDRPAVAEPVLPAADVVAGFEIGMLLRCVRAGSGRHEHRDTASTWVEFSRAEAAARLVTLLGAIGRAAVRDEYVAGGRHRYRVHRVTCADLTDPRITRAWCTGYRRLCDADGYRPARQRHHRVRLAAGAWRAAILAGGTRGRGGGPLAIRAPDPEVALVLVRAARVLDAPVALRTTGGRHLIEVTAGAAELALRQLALVTRAG